MKQNVTFKSVLITASFLSLLAFAFVNLRPNTTLPHAFTKIEMAQTKVESEESNESREIHVPNVSVLGRLWDIAQRLMYKAH